MVARASIQKTEAGGLQRVLVQSGLQSKTLSQLTTTKTMKFKVKTASPRQRGVASRQIRGLGHKNSTFGN